MFVRVFKCFPLFVCFLSAPGVCRIGRLLFHTSGVKNALSSQFVVQDVQRRINRPMPDFILTCIAIQTHAEKSFLSAFESITFGLNLLIVRMFSF